MSYSVQYSRTCGVVVEVKAVDSRVESALEEVESLVCSAVELMEEDSTGLVGVGSLCRLV